MRIAARLSEEINGGLIKRQAELFGTERRGATDISKLYRP